MGILTKTNDFTVLEPDIALMRSFIAGNRALRNPELILMPPSWSQDEKEAFLKNAYIFNATTKTIAAFSGMVCNAAPVFDVSQQTQDVLDNIVAKGYGINDLTQDIAKEVMTVGFQGVLIDYPRASLNLTIQEQQAQQIRPFAATYAAENIIECLVEKINAEYIVTLVRLLEYKRVKLNEWDFKHEKQVRVLRLIDGIYTQELYDDEGNIIESFTPLANGKTLNRIPFILINAENKFNAPCNPPLIELADINLRHINNGGWHEHGLKFCGMPFYWVAGWTPPQDGDAPKIGVDTFMTFPDAAASANVTQASADSLGAINKAMEDKRSDMAVIGARFIAETSNAQQAENTALIHRSGDNATLSSITNAIEGALLFICNWVSIFIGDDYPNAVTMSRDYLPTKADPQMITVLMTGVQNGTITMADFYDNMVKLKIVQARQNGFADYQDELSSAVPSDLARIAPNG